MSLINDALKQARQSQPNNPPSGSPPPLSPVESASRGGINWFLLALIVLLLVAAGFFFGLSLSKPAPLPPATVVKRSSRPTNRSCFQFPAGCHQRTIRFQCGSCRSAATAGAETPGHFV